MELELLEQIADDRYDLAFALMIYRGDVAHLRATLLGQVADELIGVWKSGSAIPISVSELKAVFADTSSFDSPQKMAN